MAKLKDTGSVALYGKTACSFKKSAGLDMNTFDYQVIASRIFVIIQAGNHQKRRNEKIKSQKS